MHTNNSIAPIIPLTHLFYRVKYLFLQVHNINSSTYINLKLSASGSFTLIELLIIFHIFYFVDCLYLRNQLPRIFY